MLKFKKFFTLALLAAVVGMFTTACIFEIDDEYFDGTSKLRFSWESKYTDDKSVWANIETISASVNDVEWWYDEVYMKEYHGVDMVENMIELPLFDGNPDIPDNIYNGNGNANNGKYFTVTGKGGEVDKDGDYWYTAIASGEDEHDEMFDIVANYFIRIDRATASADGVDLFFEVAFDIEAILDGEDLEDWWIWDVNNSSAVKPIFSKRKVKTVTKKSVVGGVTTEVTYHLLRRPKK